MKAKPDYNFFLLNKWQIYGSFVNRTDYTDNILPPATSYLDSASFSVQMTCSDL